MINRASVQLWGHSETIGRPAKIGREKKWSPILCMRSCGTDPILSTQRFPRGRDPILSTQRIWGGDVDENGCFTIVKCMLRFPGHVAFYRNICMSWSSVRESISDMKYQLTRWDLRFGRNVAMFFRDKLKQGRILSMFLHDKLNRRLKTYI